MDDIQILKKQNPIFAIFLTVFIDMLGVGVMIPILTPLIINNESGILSESCSLENRKIIYGFLTATFSFCQFFGAPILGALADQFGRKKILSFTIFGTFVGYMLFAFAIHFHTIYLLFVARAIPGFMGGNISIATAALADISDEKTRTKNFGLIGMSFGMGFILGPAIGGFLATVDYALPLLFTAALTLLNFYLVKRQFPETFLPALKRKVSLYAGFHNIGKAFRLKEFRVILLVLFLQAFGFTFFTQFFTVFMNDKFHIKGIEIAYIFTYMGIWIAFTQGVITRFISKKIPAYQVLVFSILGMSLASLAILFPAHIWGIYLIHPLLAISQGLTQPNITSVISSLGTSENQGEVLGIQTSVQSLAFFIPPILAGFISILDYRLPIVLGSFFLLCSWVIFYFGFYKAKIRLAELN